MARTFYGLHDREFEEVTEFRLTREEVEEGSAGILGDEPGWHDRFEVVVERPATSFGGRPGDLEFARMFMREANTLSTP